ncbi:hypothetical protein [Thermobispora bispora]|nr:hypothetical protein [Thermobispora bispora]MDI9580037.1 hypothetical protein [Thermobispora sp.]QSI46611.1 hypothetical protein CYL17_01110 [Thermobispora bispora]
MRPRIEPMLPPPATPSAACAQQLQAHLTRSYAIPSQLQTNGDVALLIVGRELHVWVYADRILWDSGKIDERTRTKIFTALPAGQPARAAGLVAGRYHQIRRERG